MAEVKRLIRWIRAMEGLGLRVSAGSYHRAMIGDSSFVPGEKKPVLSEWGFGFFKRRGIDAYKKKWVDYAINLPAKSKKDRIDNMLKDLDLPVVSEDDLLESDKIAPGKMMFSDINPLDDGIQVENSAERYIAGIDPVDGESGGSLVLDKDGKYVSGSWYHSAERDAKLKFMEDIKKNEEEYQKAIDDRLRLIVLGGSTPAVDGLFSQMVGRNYDELPDSSDVTRNMWYEEFAREYPEEAKKIGWQKSQHNPPQAIDIQGDWNSPAPKSGWRSTGDDTVDAMAMSMLIGSLYSERNYKLPRRIRFLNWLRKIFNTK